jgi:hypothetical protein
MKTLLAVAIALLALSVGGSARADYGSIAYSPSTGQTGWSYSYPSLRQAEELALSYCAEPDCRVAIWAGSGCAALAKGANGAWGWATGATAELASASAEQWCAQYDSGCATERWVCSN